MARKVALRRALRFSVREPAGFIATPEGFSWVNNPLINRLFRDRNGNIYTDFNVAVLQPVGKEYFVDAVNGNDTTGNGLTLATAFKTLSKALSMGDVVVIWLAAGKYINTTNVTSTLLSIKAITPGTVSITTAPNLTWTKTAGQTYVYQATIVTCGRVFDKSQFDTNMDYKDLSVQTSVANVDTNPGSCYVSGTTLYAHAHDNRSLIGDTYLYAIPTTTYPISYRGNGTLYLEGLSIEGGQACLQVYNDGTKPNQTIYAKNCVFRQSSADNAISVLGAALSIMQDCVGTRGFRDGFNYHANAGSIPKFIEINCVGRYNGVTDTVNNNNNGSTSHDGVVGIRVNCTYFGNKGMNVADTASGTMTWNLGCKAYGSVGATAASNCDYIASTGTVKMWLDNCLTLPGSIYSISTDASTALLYIHNGTGLGGNSYLYSVLQYY